MQDKSLWVAEKDNPLRAHRLKLHLMPDQPLVVPMPPDVREADVEVIVLIADRRPPDANMRTLEQFDAWLASQAWSGRSVQEMDAGIAEQALHGEGHLDHAEAARIIHAARAAAP